MPQDAKCPKCTHLFPVTEERQAFTVACPKCDADMTVEFKTPATPPDAGRPPFDLLVRPGARPGANAAPKAPKKRREDDDEQPNGGGGSVLIVVFSGVLGLLFVLGGLGFTAWVLFTQIDTTNTSSNWTGFRKNTGSGNATDSGNATGPGNKGNTTGPSDQGSSNRADTGRDSAAPPLPMNTGTAFELRPIAGGDSAVTPPPLTDNVTPLDLPGKVGQIAVGGGGRYIVMHFPDVGQIGVLDVTTAVSSFERADPGDGVRIAAGSGRVVLFSPATKMMQVYTLPDLTKRSETLFPVDNCKSIAMGSRTNGPMLVVAGSGEVVLASVTDGGVGVITGTAARPGVYLNNLRAAPDGRAFTTFDGFGAGNKVRLLTESGREWKVTEMGPALFPGADGNLYGNGTALSRTKQTVMSGAGGTWYVPAVTGSGGDFAKLAVSAKDNRAAITFHSGRNPDGLAPGTLAMTGPEIDKLIDARGDPADKAPDQHLFYSPEAKLLVLLTESKNRLILRKTQAN